MENLENINYLETAKKFVIENNMSFESSILLIIAEEINLLRREVNELKQELKQKEK